MPKHVRFGITAEGYLKKLAKRMRGMLEVGFIDTDEAQIAFWNEFGHGGRFPAPARPFFRNMVRKDSPSWGPTMAKYLKTKVDGTTVLSLMGEKIDGELKQSIIETNDPPLSPVTLRLREKFGDQPQNIRARDVLRASGEVKTGAKLATGTQAKPLVWTGAMLHSTGYRVKSGSLMALNQETGTYQARK